MEKKKKKHCRTKYVFLIDPPFTAKATRLLGLRAKLMSRLHIVDVAVNGEEAGGYLDGGNQMGPLQSPGVHFAQQRPVAPWITLPDLYLLLKILCLLFFPQLEKGFLGKGGLLKSK